MASKRDARISWCILIFILIFAPCPMTSSRNHSLNRRLLLPVYTEDDNSLAINNKSDAMNVRFAFFRTPTEFVECPDDSSSEWSVAGRDPEIIRMVAAHTRQLDGCVDVDIGADSVGEILENAHVFGTSLHVTFDLMKAAQLLYPHVKDNLCFLVGGAGFVNRSILNSFQMLIYITTSACLLAFIYTQRILFNIGTSSAAIDTARTFLTGSVNRRRRSLMIWCCLLHVILLNSFAGVFTSFLTVPKLGPEFNTIEDVVENVDVIIPPENLLDDTALMKQEFSSKFDFPSLRWEEIEKRIKARQLALLLEESLLETMIMVINARQRYTWHKVPQCVLSPAYKAFPVRKNWLLADRYSALIQRLVEGGIVKKVHDDATRNYIRARGVRYVPKIIITPEPPKPLKVRHFREAFLVLCFGLGAALLCFAVEAMRKLWATVQKKARDIFIYYIKTFPRRIKFLNLAWFRNRISSQKLQVKVVENVS